MDRTAWLTVAAVAGGSALGGVLRYLVSETLGRGPRVDFPWTTVAINVAGSLAIGAVFASADLAGGGAWSPAVRHGVMTGVLGGFTTFSALSLQTILLLQQGALFLAMANVASSVGLGLLACWAGMTAVTRLR